MPAFYAGKRVGKPLMGGHTYNAMFNGKLVWPLDKDTVVSVNITDDKGKPLPKSLAVSGTVKLSGTGIAGLTTSVKFLDAQGHQLEG